MRVYLGALAILLSVGGAIASSLLVPQNPVYQFIDNPTGTPDECEAIDLTCDTSGAWDCRVSMQDPILKTSSIVGTTQCGTALKRNSQPPAQ